MHVLVQHVKLPRKVLKKIQLKNKECCELISIDKSGTYALKFKWADGHETGIYSFESLKII